MRLGELLVRHQGVTAEAVDAALEEQHERGGLLGELLIAAKAVDEANLSMALAQQAGCAFRKQIDANAIPDELLDLVPLSFARSRQVLPLEPEPLTSTQTISVHLLRLPWSSTEHSTK